MFDRYRCAASTQLTHNLSISCRIKGLYYRHLAEYGSGTDIDAIIENFKKSGELYLEAALTFPEDDEQHVCASHSFLLGCLPSFFRLFSLSHPAIYCP